MNCKRNKFRKVNRSNYGGGTFSGFVEIFMLLIFVFIIKAIFDIMCAIAMYAFIGAVIWGIVWLIAKFHEEILALLSALVQLACYITKYAAIAAWYVAKYLYLGISWCCKKIFGISRAYLQENKSTIYNKCSSFLGKTKSAVSRFWAWLY